MSKSLSVHSVEKIDLRSSDVVKRYVLLTPAFEVEKPENHAANVSKLTDERI